MGFVPGFAWDDALSRLRLAERVCPARVASYRIRSFHVVRVVRSWLLVDGRWSASYWVVALTCLETGIAYHGAHLVRRHGTPRSVGLQETSLVPHRSAPGFGYIVIAAAVGDAAVRATGYGERQVRVGFMSFRRCLPPPVSYAAAAADGVLALDFA